MSIRALFIDIDETILVATPQATAAKLFTAEPMFDVMAEAAVRFAGLSEAEARRRIDHINTHVSWWHWSDFIVELELEPAQFWELAYERHRQLYRPSGPELGAALGELQAAGYGLYITSNNPSSGILHKLRLAGLGTIQGCALFSQFLGATELHAMKWEPRYWRKALAHTGLSAHEVAVVGDNPRDDSEIPRSVGIPLCFLIDRRTPKLPPDSDAVRHIDTFARILPALRRRAAAQPRAVPAALASLA